MPYPVRLAGAAAATLLAAACSAGPEVDARLAAAPPGRPAPANTAVLTQKNEPSRTGWNSHETILDQAAVDPARFGRRVTYPVDGAVYAQPLFVPGLVTADGTHNAVVVATEHDSVYAFDADVRGAPRAPLWHRSLLPAGANPVSARKDVTCAAISPEVGVTGTPVIDAATNTLYVVATTREHDGVMYRVHALDVRTGQDRTAPARIEASVPGTAADATRGQVVFEPRYEQQRMGLLLLGGVIYVSFASYCDEGPSHGWILGYRAADLARVVVYNVSPDSGSSGRRPGGGGLWQSQTGLAADAHGSIYVVTGNGPFNLDTGGRNAGNSLLRLVPDDGTLRQADYFAPAHQDCLNDHDQDLGSGGPLLLPGHDEVLFIGKEGRFYLTRTDHLGGHRQRTEPCAMATRRTDADDVVQELPDQTVVGGVWGSETYWRTGNREFIYTAGISDHLSSWQLTPAGTVATPATAQAPEEMTYPGGVPVVSSNGDTAGSAVVWVVAKQDNGQALRAYDPGNVSHELYNSDQNSGRDRLTSYTNFTVPTVAAGRVFIGTRDCLAVFGPLTG